MRSIIRELTCKTTTESCAKFVRVFSCFSRPATHEWLVHMTAITTDL